MGVTVCYSSDNHVPVRLLTQIFDNQAIVHIDVYFKSHNVLVLAC